MKKEFIENHDKAVEANLKNPENEIDFKSGPG